ncbi:SinI family autotransporter-associated protein [Citrobacter sp. R-1.5.2]|uniref:SinI family autotransporter-associated protein n=1 Tax=Citrobacter sp. R-1.5.2 TaxID=3046183 RepID=UPI001079408A|nr:SinI family autotransporter-associated protein [Citrobacter sp. R-1.5.2]MEB2420384.1 SinI family autotransporter-associated protein [Citrobacter sp. R-1.5.2]
MQVLFNRRLTRVALALVVAGYCSVPAMAADGNLKSGQWQILTDSTGSIQGTIPWITRAEDKVAETDKNHVVVTIDRGSRTIGSGDGDKQFHIGDKVTVNWAIGDTEGDLDTGNTATKATVIWVRSKNQDGSDAEEISGTTGQDTYTIQADDADYYLGIKITPTTTTGDPNVATVLLLNDLSTNAGGGADDDDIPEGPVVDDNVKVAIYESGTTANLLGNTSTKLKTNTTYKVLLWKDKNGNNTYDTGEDVTSSYNYRWKFTGTSLQLGAAGGIVNESFNNSDLVIPVTNAEAKTAFDNGESGGVTLGNDGVQGYGLSIDYQRK